MKIFLLFLTICFAIANAQFYYDKHGECRGAYKDSLEHSTLVGFAKRFHGPILVKKPIKGVKPKKNLKKIPQKKIQRTFNVSRDTLNKENWLEVEKNEFVKICVDAPVVAWETSLNSSILNDSCLAFQAPMYVGVETLNVHFYKEYMPYYINFYNDIYSYNINLAIGMKHLDFHNESILLGFNKYPPGELDNEGEPRNEDPERLVLLSGTYLVDKYPITNCEFLQLMWNNITTNPSFTDSDRQEIAQKWAYRKKHGSRNNICAAHDSAASSIILSQAIEYANARSIREGLKPYYIISEASSDLFGERMSRVGDKWIRTIVRAPRLLSKGRYVIAYYDFSLDEYGRYVLVSVDTLSDGYRLPYYDEWMMFARGGDKMKKAPWGDTTATLEEASKYAKFATGAKAYTAEPVGELQPNGYGLYDIFGLVSEHVLFEERNPFKILEGRPSCLKGGNNHARKDHIWYKAYRNPYWKWINYGYTYPNYVGSAVGGFRLIRNIGDNAKWTEVKSK
jgi:formylglycine-generating enzyme required for sulfatase activity